MSGATWDVVVGPTCVHGWSRVRLPFEPRGDLREYRDELRAAVRKLSPTPNTGLVVRYESPSDDFADLDNVALYNIGTGSYSHLLKTGLYCERVKASDTRHHLTYQVAELPQISDAGLLLASIRTATPTELGAAAAWWATTRPAVVNRSFGIHDGLFTVAATLSGDWRPSTVANLVKPMLDGVVSALHAHDGSAKDALLAQLDFEGNPSRTWERLTDRSAALLGTRPLVRPYLNRIAWNPADERCSAFRISIQPGTSRSISIDIRQATRALNDAEH